VRIVVAQAASNPHTAGNSANALNVLEIFISLLVKESQE
jgi:hypothetical protein